MTAKPRKLGSGCRSRCLTTLDSLAIRSPTTAKCKTQKERGMTAASCYEWGGGSNVLNGPEAPLCLTQLLGTGAPSAAVPAVRNPPAFPPFLRLMRTRGEDIRPSISRKTTSHVFWWISADVPSPRHSFFFFLLFPSSGRIAPAEALSAFLGGRGRRLPTARVSGGGGPPLTDGQHFAPFDHVIFCWARLFVR